MRLIALCLMSSLFACAVGLVPAGMTAWAEEGDQPAPVAPADEPATPDEQPAAKPEPKADPKIPAYSIEFLMPTEDKTPAGWKLVSVSRAGSGAPSEGELVALAEDFGLDDDVFYAELTGLEKDGQVAGVAMVDVDKNVYAFQHALKEKAGVRGWRVHELGSPARLLVIGGAASLAADAEKAMVEHTVYRLARMAMNRLNGRGALEDTARDTALAYGRAIDSIKSGTGVASVIVGRNHFILARLEQWKGKKGAKIDKEENQKAAAAFQLALAEGVPYPPKERILVWAAGELGGMLLVRKDKSVVPAATRALELAVKNEKHAREQQQRFSNRYNLACAYALGGDKDKAIEACRNALETMKSLKGNVARKSWEDMGTDKDFSSIRGDPRFSKLYADYEPKKPKNWDRMKAEQEKRKREAEKKKEDAEK